MKVQTIRARYCNPEKWVATGLTWAVLTDLLMIGFELLRTGGVDQKSWLAVLIMLAIGAPIFGLLCRHISRRAQDHAR